MDAEEYDEIIRHLLRIAERQETINEDMCASMLQQGTINESLTTAIERLDTAIERLDITQARIETVLTRLLRHEERGRET